MLCKGHNLFRVIDDYWTAIKNVLNTSMDEVVDPDPKDVAECRIMEADLLNMPELRYHEKIKVHRSICHDK